MTGLSLILLLIEHFRYENSDHILLRRRKCLFGRRKRILYQDLHSIKRTSHTVLHTPIWGFSWPKMWCDQNYSGIITTSSNFFCWACCDTWRHVLGKPKIFIWLVFEICFFKCFHNAKCSILGLSQYIPSKRSSSKLPAALHQEHAPLGSVVWPSIHRKLANHYYGGNLIEMCW